MSVPNSHSSRRERKLNIHKTALLKNSLNVGVHFSPGFSTNASTPTQLRVTIFIPDYNRMQDSLQSKLILLRSLRFYINEVFSCIHTFYKELFSHWQSKVRSDIEHPSRPTQLSWLHWDFSSQSIEEWNKVTVNTKYMIYLYTDFNSGYKLHNPSNHVSAVHCCFI